MTRESPDFTNLKLGETRLSAELEGRSEFQQATRAMLTQARRQVVILSWDLEPWLYNQQEIIQSLRSRIVQEQHLRVRVLIQHVNPSTLLNHRLLHMARTLSTYITIRKTDETRTEPLAESFLGADHVGYLHRPMFDLESGLMNFHDPRRTRELWRYFDDTWAQGAAHLELRSMRL